MRSTHILIFALILAALGCGGKRNVRVWGDVTSDGKPIEQGEIEFKPVDGTSGPTTGGTITNGRYDVPANVGLLVGGVYAVSISGYAKTGRKIQTAPGHFVDALDNVIPERYNRHSTLRVTIDANAAEGRHDFALEGTPAKRTP